MVASKKFVASDEHIKNLMINPELKTSTTSTFQFSSVPSRSGGGERNTLSKRYASPKQESGVGFLCYDFSAEIQIVFATEGVPLLPFEV